MSRNLPELMSATRTDNESRRKAHAALDVLLDRVNLHRMTGKQILTLESYEGGIRSTQITTSENLKS